MNKQERGINADAVSKIYIDEGKRGNSGKRSYTVKAVIHGHIVTFARFDNKTAAKIYLGKKFREIYG